MTHIQLGTPVVWCWDILNVRLVREPADFAATDLTHLTHMIKRKLKKIQYRPHLVDGCLPPAGLREFNLSTRDRAGGGRGYYSFRYRS
ncbi:hypothetical protein [Streptomyces sp. NBC_01451]|uniref:hypothetical protein n=1 Tax=Streptomyces sp. NBC_01451 TaxID=2903872 RepID=UPI002E36D426|nr:hypothetical protein [Streptomyces sp. NBC_01451]